VKRGEKTRRNTRVLPRRKRRAITADDKRWANKQKKRTGEKRGEKGDMM